MEEGPPATLFPSRAGIYLMLVPVLFVLGSMRTAEAQVLKESIEVDPSAASHPFPHFWEQMFGSGRAILSLRDSYRRDLRDVKQATGFEYVRFHAIFAR